MIASRSLKNWGPARALVKKSAKLSTVDTNGTRKEWFHALAHEEMTALDVLHACVVLWIV